MTFLTASDVHLCLYHICIERSFVYFRVDMRSNKRTCEPILIHRKGTKVVGLHCNPLQPELFLSCGNDHFVSKSNYFIDITFRL